VFTLPDELRDVAARNPVFVYNLLFDAASSVLRTLAAQRMHASLAMLATLHTWTRELAYHPHVHFIVSAGGLRDDNQAWVPTRPDFLFPIRVMQALFRGRVLARLHQAFREGKLDLDGRGFASSRKRLQARRWVVHVDAPEGRRPESIVRYLARYVYGIAISDHRLVCARDGTVTFKTRADDTLTLSGIEFVRRYALHVVPSGLRRLRSYGLLAPSNIRTRLEIARRLLEERPPDPPSPERSVPVQLTEAPLLHRQLPLCPCCGDHRLVQRPLPLPLAVARGPP
jgi:hypothetical protein